MRSLYAARAAGSGLMRPRMLGYWLGGASAGKYNTTMTA